jgi:hypothetical protein
MDVRLFNPQIEREEIEYIRAQKKAFRSLDYTDLRKGFHRFQGFILCQKCYIVVPSPQSSEEGEGIRGLVVLWN